MAKLRHSRFDCNPGCAVEAAISLIDGKWKCVILYHLLGGTARFNEIRRLVPCLTPRMLTNQLRELEIDGLVTRTVYAQVPPKVEYSVSDLGRSLEPFIRALGIWGTEHMNLFQRQKPPPPAGLFQSVNQPGSGSV
jgi:DNA-binding HxlR family transcriptional regulator